MSQIVNIHVGTFGSRVGAEYWKLLDAEYEMAGSKDVSKNTDFEEGLYGGHTPRAVMIDSDKRAFGSLNDVYPVRKLKIDSCIIREDFWEMNSVEGDIMEAVSVQAEQCDNLAGFNIHLPLTGRVGTGFCSRVLHNLKAEYPGKLVQLFALQPEANNSLVSNKELYRTLMNLHHIDDSATVVALFSNPAVQKKCDNELKCKQPTFSTINQAIARFLTGISSSYRFPGLLHTSPRKMLTCLVINPGSKYFLPSSSPFCNLESEIYLSGHAQQLLATCINPKSTFSSVNTTKGVYVSSYATFRGSIDTFTMEASMDKLMTKKSSIFVDWVGKNISYSASPFAGLKFGSKQLEEYPSVYSLSFNTAVKDWFQWVTDSLKRGRQKKTYHTQMAGEGIEDEDIAHAFDKVKSIIDAIQFENEGEGRGDDPALVGRVGPRRRQGGRGQGPLRRDRHRRGRHG